VESAARPGVAAAGYASLTSWLLDAPGIIPAKLDQTAALKLAICDDIGDAHTTTNE